MHITLTEPTSIRNRADLCPFLQPRSLSDHLPRVSCRSAFCRRVRFIMVEKGFIGNAAEESFASIIQVSKITCCGIPATMSEPTYLEM
jgi:hypothetical protein